MLLDIYYKLFWWYAKCAALFQASLTIPLTYFADGNAYNSVVWTDSSSEYTALVNALLAKPYAGMLSQSKEPEDTLFGTSVWGNYTNFVLGTGATPVTGGDYRIEQEIVTGLACDAVSSEVNDDTCTVIFRKTVRNTTDADITIREVGLTGSVSPKHLMKRQVLIYREVLEEPVTIAPGDSATLRITIRHALPV